MTDSLAADAEVLHAAMVPFIGPDGVFGRNLGTVAAEIGWYPERVSLAMQKLVEQERVQPVHEDGRADRVVASRWLVIDAEPSVTDGAPAMTWTVKQLRAYAEKNRIDLGDATKKADIRKRIDAALEGEPDLGHREPEGYE
jgi:hypothetical protein